MNHNSLLIPHPFPAARLQEADGGKQCCRWSRYRELSGPGGLTAHRSSRLVSRRCGIPRDCCFAPAAASPLTALTFLLLLTICPLNAQPQYEPLHREVYSFLDRLANRGIVAYNDLIKPLGRDYLARKLQEAEAASEQLTPLERQELAFLKGDFYYELQRLSEVAGQGSDFTWARKDAGRRWRAFSYRDQRLTLTGDPVYGLEYGQNDGESESHRWNGVALGGYLTDYLAYSFSFRDNREEGANIDINKTFSPQTGVIPQFFAESNAIEYSETHNSIATGWDWGSLSIGKNFMSWGYGKNSQVVLSTRAPSFPVIRIDLQPAEWLSFNYFHGWLESLVVDSSASFRLPDGRLRTVFRDKYIASHTLTLRPWQGLHLSIGESMVYSDRLEFAYLMPLMFFRLADHYVSNRDNSAGDNAQLFFGLSSRNHLPHTHLYMDFFLDDISLPNIFNKDKQINSVAWTWGVAVSNPGLANLTLTVEYSRVNPFLYNHFIPTATYRSSGYRLGHWMGDNADLLFAALNYQLRRGLQATVHLQRLRKGEEGDSVRQYQLPRPGFLFGENSDINEWGVELKYQIVHELFLRLSAAGIEAGGPLEPGRTGNQLALALYYGR